MSGRHFRPKRVGRGRHALGRRWRVHWVIYLWIATLLTVFWIGRLG